MAGLTGSQTGDDMTQGAGLGMMGGPLGAGIGAGVGLLKGLLIDGPREKREKAAAAQEALAAPWTGMKAQDVHYADPFGSGLQGATGGAGLAQSFQNAQGNQAFQNAQVNYMNSQAKYLNNGINPWLQMVGPPAPAQNFSR